MINKFKSRGFQSINSIAKFFHVPIDKVKEIIKIKKIPVIKTSRYTYVNNRYMNKLYYFLKRMK